MRLATRGSALALAQAQIVRAALEAEGAEVEVVTVKTGGDTGARPAGDKSRWVAEIEDALLRGDADLAVHSAKDVPGELADGLAIVGVPARADARDALVGATDLGSIPHGGRVGTSSLRRRSQLLALRPDLEIGELRGNVDTRLRKASEWDAIVLARAGLERLGHDEGVPIALDELLPAPGQGCLALEAGVDDAATAALAAAITDRDSLVRLT
ncbi:MAG: hydroxymethylbilane synthase, partial [Thermoleophilaceae bacterium]|nr:hydroxymethylbilane synthase [Thermoleophilaceae bacterium]